MNDFWYKYRVHQVIKQDLIRNGYPDNEATTAIARKVFD